MDKDTKDRNTEIIKVIIDKDDENRKVKEEKSDNTIEIDKEGDDTRLNSAKELFSDFKHDSENDCQFDEESDSDSEPLIKKVKTKKEKEDSSSKDKTGPRIYKKKHYLQKYKKEWEMIPALKPWLSESTIGESYFYCKFCKKDYRCGRTEIFKHMASLKHQKHVTKPVLRVQKKFSFRGLLCPVFTPFEKTRPFEVNYKILRPYAKFLKVCGVKGILINDILGEGMSLTIEERKQITEHWAEICKESGQFLMVQVGGAPMRNVIEMAIHAERHSVGAIILLPDLYNRPKSHLDLIRYIKIVSEYCKQMPILYHHNPKYTKVEMDVTSFLLDITGEVDSFVGLIYSTNDLSEGLSAMSLNPEKFSIFMGTDDAILGAVSSGFTCIMGNSINILPKLAESLCQCAKNGEIKSAQASQNLMKRALDYIYSNGETVPALKAAMTIISNLPMLTTREPLQIVWEGTVSKMRNKLHEIGII